MQIVGDCRISNRSTLRGSVLRKRRVCFAERQQAALRLVPHCKPGALEALPELDAVHLLKLGRGSEAVLQPIVRDDTVEVMNVMEPDVAGEPFERLGQRVVRRAANGSDLEIPLVACVPVTVLELVLDEELLHEDLQPGKPDTEVELLRQRQVLNRAFTGDADLLLVSHPGWKSLLAGKRVDTGDLPSTLIVRP